MALRLRVVSDQRRWLGPKSTIVFGVAGGSIGRSTENDWVLPDPERYVSGRHARVIFSQGGYYLTDVSTNGTFVNDIETPIGPEAPYELKNGDVLRLGEYHIVVARDSATDFAPDDSGMLDTATSARRRRNSDVDLGASLQLEALLEPSRNSNSASDLKPVNAFGQAITRTPADGAQSVDEAAAVARRIARLARAATKQQQARGGNPGIHDVQTGLQTFCRGAGIDPDQIPPDAQTRILHLAGQLLRESLLGLKDVARAKRSARNSFRIAANTSDTATRPSLEQGTVEELLLQLLRAHEARTRDGVQWLRDTFAETRQHDAAIIEAMRGAFVEFLSRLDPADLSARFERAGRRKLIGGGNQNWELYGEFYRNLTDMPKHGMPHVFVESFAMHYSKALAAAKLPPPAPAEAAPDAEQA
ncbi:MAG TPA: type VI secretion system-associated FHA domain protein TagH [Steroidobacteraceae bacterium]|nr:type VI secretion system-associated FHA domain protein TagH [Steroidobacteraceae bacterium]HRX90554.1 type VI secretion system-associated FHA domain protein TagH [Steroidobacteraceae bacterium]